MKDHSMDSAQWDSKKMRVTISEKSIHSTSSSNLVASTSENGEERRADREWETYGLMAPIVDFTKEGPKPNSKPYPQLSQILRNGPSKVLKEQKSSAAVTSNDILFRWIHIPVNKMDWAQVGEQSFNNRRRR
jgi:hypothetical protein